MNNPIFIPMTVSADVASVPMTVAADAVVLPVTLGVIIEAGSATYYDGPYDVVPNRENQVLQTAQKIASRNIVVYEIPYVEVRNPVGGKTVTIGGT